MRLVVDGTPLCTQLTGIGQYTLGILNALSKLRPDWEIVVVAPYLPTVNLDAPNIRFDPSLCEAKSTHARGWRAWWFDAVLPGIVQRVRPHVFWAADGLMPYRLKAAATALTVYDFVPFRFPQTMAPLPRWVRKTNQRVALKRATWRLPISHAVAAEMAHTFGLRADAVVPPGISPLFTMTKRPASASKSSYFIVLGTLEPRKNLARLFDCVQQLHEEGTWPNGLELRVVGGKGWQDAQVLDRLDLLESKGVCCRLGYVERDELPRLLAGARALLMPSLYEGFGMPVAEALAAGCPVICSDIAPFREIAGTDNAVYHAVDRASMLSTYRAVLDGSVRLPNPVCPEWVGRYTWDASATAFAAALERSA